MLEGTEFIHNSIFPLISDKIPLEDFNGQMNDLKKQTDSLVDESVLALIILHKYNRCPIKINEIDKLESSKEVTLLVEITEIEPKRIYTRKDGGEGAVININAEDRTGRCRLILWDTKHHEFIENNIIKKHSHLLIGKTKPKEGVSGYDLNIGGNSLLKVLTEDEVKYWHWLMAEKYVLDESSTPELQTIEELYKGQDLIIVNLKATIQSTGKLREFNRSSESKGYVINYRIFDGTAEAVLTLWDNHAVDNQSISIGDIVIIKNGRVKMREGMVEIHSGYQTIIECL